MLRPLNAVTKIVPNCDKHNPIAEKTLLSHSSPKCNHRRTWPPDCGQPAWLDGGVDRDDFLASQQSPKKRN